MSDGEILEKIRRLEEEVRSMQKRKSPVEDPPPKKRRRRIIYSSSESEPDENEKNNVSKGGSDGNDIDKVLGVDPTITNEFGEDIHATLAVRWTNILYKGLKSEIRTELSNKYLPPPNCKFIIPPILNEEIKRAVKKKSVITRDEKIEFKQKQVGTALTCIARAMDVALKVNDTSVRDQIIKHSGDGGQILADAHYLTSNTRRFLLTQNLNKHTAEAIKHQPRDQFLFGENLPDKLKAAKACSKSAAELEIKQTRPSTSRQRFGSKTFDSPYIPAVDTLNWRGTSRRTTQSNAAAAGTYFERRPAAAAAPRPATRRTQAGPRQQPKRS